MPTQTFYNLSEEKRDKIIKAAKEEFLSNKFINVSIKNIIEKAGIPRGSFYQYFEDKEDLYIYILELFHSAKIDILDKELSKNNDDIFDLVKKIFVEEIEFLSGDKDNKSIRNLIKHLDFSCYKKSLLKDINTRIHAKKDILALFNKDKYNLKTPDDVVLVAQILVGTTITIIASFHNREISKEKAIEQFEKTIHIIKNGVKK